MIVEPLVVGPESIPSSRAGYLKPFSYGEMPCSALICVHVVGDRGLGPA